MPIMSKPSAAPKISLTFITLGVLMAIPAAVSYAMFQPEGVGRFFCVTFFLLGLAFMIIGFSVGYIGRSARHAELPPAEATAAVVQQDQALVNRGVAPAGTPTAPAPPQQNPAAGAVSSTIV